MIATWRPGPGLDRKQGESWGQVIIDAIKAGTGPVIPGYIYRDLKPDQAGSILDFGCGVGAMDGALHVQALKALGYEVYGYDFDPGPGTRADTYAWLVDKGLLDPKALTYAYDIVMANNIINVQPSGDALAATLRDLRRAMDQKSSLILNLPSSPKGLWDNNAQLEDWLKEKFRTVESVEAGIWVCKK